MSREAPLARDKGTGQAVSVGVGSTPSTSILGDAGPNIDLKGVRIVATVDCWYEIGEAPVAAATTSTFLPAYQVEYKQAKATDKVAFIRHSGDGSAYIRPLA